MIVLAHRGYWQSPEERNTLAAFERAFAAGFGVELDVRDLDGELVISHDPPRAGALRFEDVLARYREAGLPGKIAINIKADGLAPAIAQATEAYGARAHCFVFDMAVPDMLAYPPSGLVTFTRFSEYEPQPSRLAESDGVWVDAFERPWADEERMLHYLAHGKLVAMVSPELHGKPNAPAWSVWREALRQAGPTHASDALMICTDRPDAARRFFTDGERP